MWLRRFPNGIQICVVQLYECANLIKLKVLEFGKLIQKHLVPEISGYVSPASPIKFGSYFCSNCSLLDLVSFLFCQWEMGTLVSCHSWRIGRHCRTTIFFNIRDAPSLQILNFLAFLSHWFVNSFFELKFLESRRSISILKVFFLLFRDLNDKVRVDHRIFCILKSLCLVNGFSVFKDAFTRSNNKCPHKTTNPSERMHWSRSWWI